jgi:hypothetical protein
VDVNRAEQSLNDLIESRAMEAGGAEREAAAWAASVQRYDLARVREQRQAWCEYHRRMISIFEGLAEEHRTSLGRIIDGR